MLEATVAAVAAIPSTAVVAETVTQVPAAANAGDSEQQKIQACKERFDYIVNTILGGPANAASHPDYSTLQSALNANSLSQLDQLQNYFASNATVATAVQNQLASPDTTVAVKGNPSFGENGALIGGKEIFFQIKTPDTLAQEEQQRVTDQAAKIVGGLSDALGAPTTAVPTDRQPGMQNVVSVPVTDSVAVINDIAAKQQAVVPAAPAGETVAAAAVTDPSASAVAADKAIAGAANETITQAPATASTVINMDCGDHNVTQVVKGTGGDAAALPVTETATAAVNAPEPVTGFAAKVAPVQPVTPAPAIESISITPAGVKENRTGAALAAGA